MTPDQFCYWLQGLLELMPDLKALDEPQLKMVRAHLGYVFERGHLDSGARVKSLHEELQKIQRQPRFGDYSPLPQTTGDKLDLLPSRVIC